MTKYPHQSIYFNGEDKNLLDTLKEEVEGLIIEYHRKVFSIYSIPENIDVTIAKVMDVLSRLNEESDVEKTLEVIEINSSD